MHWIILRTPEPNVAREYVQHVLLASLFGGIKDEVKLAFKGGTALRLLRQSPRFSEDLDFTGWSKAFHAGEWIKLAIKEASSAGLGFRKGELHAKGRSFAELSLGISRSRL